MVWGDCARHRRYLAGAISIVSLKKGRKLNELRSRLA